jgi:ABC-type transporter Mla MlaB component
VTTRLKHALEVSDGSATLYLAGPLAASDAFRLRGICVGIPARVRTLRLDLHAVTRVEEGAMDAVRAVVRYWRETREGCLRLSLATPHALTTLAVTSDSATVGLTGHAPSSPLGLRSAALMGMFL